MDIQVTGTITKILPKMEGVSAKTGKSWAKQEYVITEDGGNSQYPSSICFQIFGEEKISLMNLREGEHVCVHLDSTTNEWKEKVFNSINCWKVDRFATEQKGNAVMYANQQSPQQNDQPFPPQVNDQGVPQQQNAPQAKTNDLPF
ncbi:DUF3127 domain-containing protein [Prevotella amnii]|uniref:DUF3127 domain-containing protein n=1 Tax=Prevotella amnii TaxID=419005 RepID=UPI0006916489|nr:DUF3127 domain-containing protein [Prevotella amnii]